MLKKVLLPGKFVLFLTLFLIFALGSISGNTVPRAIFPSTLPREEGVRLKI